MPISLRGWRGGILPVLGLMVCVLGGCPFGGEDQSASPVGLWQYRDGQIFRDQMDGDIGGFAFYEDGTVVIYTRNGDTQVIGNYAGTYELTEHGLIADFPLFNHPGEQVCYLTFPSPDVLVLGDASGDSMAFTPASAIPADAQRLTMEVVQEFTVGVPPPGQDTGLAYDGSNLWYSEEETGLARSFDPQDGPVGIGLNLGADGSRSIHAIQGTDFWTLYGGTTEVTHCTPGAVVLDNIYTDDLGQEIWVDAIAYASAGETLWLFGMDGEGVWRFLTVDASGEPDTLIRTDVFDCRIRAMTWDGTYMWALAEFEGQAIVQIDMDNFRAVATYDAPNGNAEWRGIASVDGSLFLVGITTEGEGVMCEVTP